MTDYLLFTLYAPMAAMGEIAVGERRMSWPRPARSAVFGLIAAALGLERTDEDAHLALNNDYGYGVRTDAPGRPTRDFHTAQVPRGKNARNFPTRRAELSAGKLETILSTREYRMDACFTVAIWPRVETPLTTLEKLKKRLLKPHFAPYMGRKSCPFGAPFDPRIKAAENLLDAIEQYEPFCELDAPLVELRNERPVAFDHDPSVALQTGAQIEKRRDELISRRRWQFGERHEQIITHQRKETS